MWEIILGIVLIFLGLGMVASGFILFFAFNLNGWYIVFLFAIGIALILIGIILMILTNNYRTNQKLRLESSTNKYMMADPNLLKEQSAAQKQLLNKSSSTVVDDNSIGLSSQSDSSINTSNNLLTTESDSHKNQYNTEDDEDSLFVF